MELYCWSSNNPVNLFKKKSKECLAELKNWSKDEFNGRKMKLKQLTNKLKEIRNRCGHFDSGDELLKTDGEIFWKQKSRVEWLREGDKNTKFFHSKASARRQKNMICGLEDENGNWIEEVKDVDRMFCEYFTKIFTATNPSLCQINIALSDLPAKV